jgi:hypothetical protein
MSDNSNWFEQFFGNGQAKEPEKKQDQDQNEDDPNFDKDPDVPEQTPPAEPKADFFGFIKDWQNNLFNNSGNKKPEEVEKPSAEEVKFEQDPDVPDPAKINPATPNPEMFAFLKEWQDNLFNNGANKKPEEKEKPKEAPKPRNDDLIGTWWRRFTLSQFGMGMPSVPPQILTDLKLMKAKDLHELDEAISDMEKYHQRLHRKTVSVAKRIEQLKAERLRLQMLKDTTNFAKKPEQKPDAEKTNPENKDKTDKKDSTPLNQR